MSQHFITKLGERPNFNDILRLSELIKPSPKFVGKSASNLVTCHPLLIVLFNEVVEVMDCSILEGHRGKEAQDAAFNAVPKRSEVQWPNGKHNGIPSLAVDAQPHPLKLDGSGKAKLEQFWVFGGVVIGIAAKLGIKVRWGRDWDSDFDFDDQTFNDFYHWELITGEKNAGPAKGP